MKKAILLVASFLGLLFLVPGNANAKTVNVYLFRSDTCPHCQAALAYFNELAEDEEFKDLFVLQDYEVSSRQNSELMSEAAEAMGESSSGAVPYIIIGEETFLGYSESSNEKIETAIKETYENEEFVDPIAPLITNADTTNSDGVIIFGIFAGVIIIVGIGLYFARKDTTKIEKAVALEEQKEKEAKQITEEPKKEEKKATKTTTKKTTTKKSSTGKKTTTKKKTTKK